MDNDKDILFNEGRPLAFAATIESRVKTDEGTWVVEAAGTTGILPDAGPVNSGDPVIVFETGALVPETPGAIYAPLYTYAAPHIVVAAPTANGAWFADSMMAWPTDRLGPIAPAQDLTWALQVAKVPPRKFAWAHMQTQREAAFSAFRAIEIKSTAGRNVLHSDRVIAQLILPYETRYVLSDEGGRKSTHSQWWCLPDTVLTSEEKRLREALPNGWHAAYYRTPVGRVIIRKVVDHKLIPVLRLDDTPLSAFLTTPELPPHWGSLREHARYSPVEIISGENDFRYCSLLLDRRPPAEVKTTWG